MAKKSVAEINTFLNSTKENIQNFLDECSESQKMTVLSSVVSQVFFIGFTQKHACSCPPKNEISTSLQPMAKNNTHKKTTVLDSFGFSIGSTAAKINKLILSKPRSKEFLAKKTGVSSSAVTQHLQNLKKKGISLQIEKRGVIGYYSLPAVSAETEGNENAENV